MKEKVLAALIAVNGQYNLPKDVLERFAETAHIEEEDKIGAWIDSQKPVLAMMQSYADSRVTSQVREIADLKKQLEDAKKQQQTVPTDLDKQLGALIDEKLKDFSSQIDSLKQTNEELQKKLNEREGTEKERKFAELKKRVASELGISEKALAIVDGKLNSDMDEQTVNQVLSEQKKALVELGLTQVDVNPVNPTPREIVNQRAQAYLDEIKKAQESQN